MKRYPKSLRWERLPPALLIETHHQLHLVPTAGIQLRGLAARGRRCSG